ncbi:MAG: hypothetical protein D6731_20520 [Planctomycetota bacterium]|nr:MAG: hypothetical protein D6731_20520 [Planctomycetota bacterium]
MEETIRRLTKVLGAASVEVSGHDARFSVEEDGGAKLHVNIEGDPQRVMVTLRDGEGKLRCSLDVAPVSEAFEEPDFPGRVTLRVGNQLLHLDSDPSLAVELESIPPDQRSMSQRLLRAAAVEQEGAEGA